jgi:hypothetical protein
MFWRMDNWEIPEELKFLDAIHTSIDPSKVYSYIKVLWVEQVAGVFFRKALGRGGVSAWLESRCESIDIQLG